jgi:hypothetical protein
MELIPFSVKGQCTFVYECSDNTEPCSFYLYDYSKKRGLKVILDNTVNVYNITTNEKYIDNNNNVGLVHSHGSYYWLSLDAQNQSIKAGIGEPRLETMNYHYQFPHTCKSFLESIVYISKRNESVRLLRILKDPVTDRIPLVIKDTQLLTMNDIAMGSYMPKSNLSITCQKLYDCISGKHFILDDIDFPDFSKAIEYSIATPGLWCNTTLANKSKEFNKDKPNILETYLRITLGKNNGESPGVPYVMEIWPIGHYSPIHNHAEANAIIRVLHGSIHVKLFPFLCAEKDGVPPFAETNFKKDEITWISKNLNQTHQLINLENSVETCITIQCYMYDENNKSHYDYFDYIDDNGHKKQYEPDSDMDFIDFKNLMKEEWTNKKHSKKSKKITK